MKNAKASSKRLAGCRCGSDKASRARRMACVGDDFGCVAGEAGAGSAVGGVAIVDAGFFVIVVEVSGLGGGWFECTSALSAVGASLPSGKTYHCPLCGFRERLSRKWYLVACLLGPLPQSASSVV